MSTIRQGENTENGNVVGFPGSSSRSEEFHRSQAMKHRPKGLTREERQEWMRLAEELSRLGRLQPGFVASIQDLVVIRCRMRRVLRELEVEGWTYTVDGRNGRQMKMKPEVGQYNDDWRKVQRLCDRFGLNPVAEKNLNTAQGDLFENPFANLEADG